MFYGECFTNTVLQRLFYDDCFMENVYELCFNLRTQAGDSFVII